MPEAPSGTQAIERALNVLQAIAAHGDQGARLTDLVAELGLSKPTVSRLLMALVSRNMATQDPQSRRYFLGLELFSLGALAGQRLNLRRLAVDGLVQLTDQTQDTVFLSVADGRDSICIARYEGQYPIRTLTMSVGDRRPLGVGAGSLAILSSLPDVEVVAMLESNAGRYKAFGPEMSHDAMLKKVAATRAAGYASSTFFLDNGRAMPGMNAIGLPILAPRGVVIGAVSVAAVPERLQGARRSQVVQFAAKAAQVIAAAAQA